MGQRAGGHADADDWGVFVNECGIVSCGLGWDKWTAFLIARQGEGITCLADSIGGGEYHVMCGTKEAAAEARDIFVETGIHRNHVKVARLTACLETRERKNEVRAARDDAIRRQLAAWEESPERRAHLELAAGTPADWDEHASWWASIGGHHGWSWLIAARAALISSRDGDDSWAVNRFCVPATCIAHHLMMFTQFTSSGGTWLHMDKQPCAAMPAMTCEEAGEPELAEAIRGEAAAP